MREKRFEHMPDGRRPVHLVRRAACASRHPPVTAGQISDYTGAAALLGSLPKAEYRPFQCASASGSFPNLSWPKRQLSHGVEA